MAGVSGASSSSLLPSSPVYDVFIISREPDTRFFAKHLHNSLVSRGLRVFLETIELQAGQYINSQIQAAIRRASVMITIFSPNFTQSQRCLDELLLALESKATIFPVFHNVKPYDLRRGKYVEYLVFLEKKRQIDPITHEERKRFDHQTIENWRKALSDVADINGFDLEAFNGDEFELAKTVVQTVLEKVPKPPLYVAKYPTGLGDKIRDFEISVLREGLGEDRVEARVVGIVGLAGVGKTTMAKEFFNRQKSIYKTSSFLFNVGGNAATENLNSLQSHLIKDMGGVDVQICNPDEGISILRKNYSDYHALVILDGVDHLGQLDAFLPIKDVLHPDSLILVTSRDRGVLKRAGIVESSIYHLRGLSREHSLELFCFHAFSQPDPLPGFQNLADRFFNACDGLPLSLKVLGDLLRGQNEIRYWEDMLDELNKILPSDIYSTLRISYDSLPSNLQQIFLDIACFCIGEDRDTWIRIWDASGWIGFLGFRLLQDKCLVEVDSKNIIRMHNHLRVMGRDIAASSRSMALRLWQPIYNVQDINDMLMQSSPNPVVRGLRMTIEHKSPSHDVAGKRKRQSPSHDVLEMRNPKLLKALGDLKRKRQSPSHDVLEMRKLQLLEAQGDFVQSILARVQSPNLIWLYWHDCPCRFLHSWIPMRDLRVLKVNSLELQTLWEHEYQAPLELRELIIDAPLVKFPESLGKLKHLGKIVATRTSLETLPEEFYLPSLEYLELESCKLTKLWQNEYKAPPQLRRLIIEAPLVDFPKSLELLKHLEYIVGKWPCVATFPEEFNLPSLKYLELHGCKFQRLWQCKSGAPLQLTQLIIDAPIVEFPKSLRQLKHLEKIVAKGTCLETFPEDFNLPSLEYLELDSRKFQRLWQSETEAPMGLRELIIDAPLVEFPESLGKLKMLEKIVAKGTCLETFPEDFNLPSLKYLELDGCKFERLWQSEFQAPPCLKELIIDAPLVEFPKSLGMDLEKIVAKGTCLETFPEDFYLPSLKYLELDSLKLQRLWQTETEVPMKLRELIIDAPLIEFPQSLGQLQHLEKLVAKGACLERFPEKINLPSLKYLELDICKFQRLWQSDSEAPLQLRELIIDAPLVEFPKSLVQLKHLEKIVAKCTCLETFPEEFNLPSLKYLELDSFKFQRLWQSKTEAPLQLRELIIYAPLVEFPQSLGRLMHLEKLVTKGTCLETFPEEFDLPSLKYLELDGCKFQRLWQSESGVPLRLRELIIDAPLVEFPKSLGKLIELEKIVTKGTCLETFPEEFDLPSLKYLELDGCKFQRLWQSESGVPMQLRELIIDAPLIEFPQSLGQLKHLEKLVAKGACLERFPEKISLPSLKYLELDICKFQRLWQSDSEAPLQLRELIIDAPLVEFPKSLVQLKHLEKIVAKWTCLETFPEEFNLPSLKYLELDSFKFQRLWQSKTEAPLELRELIIYAPLVEFPHSLGRLMHLEKLVAKGTCLETFPEEFDLPSLKYLELDGCKFQRLWQSESGVPLRLRELIIDAPLVEFPKSLGKLEELEKIVAKGTCLETFPEEFDLPSLKYLELDGCIFQTLWQSESGVPFQLRELIIDAPLVEFPKSLGKLKKLEKIVATGTCLETFPEEFDLPSLKYLELDGCKFQRLWQSESGVPLQLRELITDAPLVEFPKSLGQLKQLEKLVAEETNLRTLPKEFCYLPCLKYLKLKDYKMHIPSNSAGDATSPQFSQFERSQNFPDSMDNLTNLEIDLQQCKSLEMLLTAISWSQSQIPSGK